jgi:hypothetical protein
MFRNIYSAIPEKNIDGGGLAFTSTMESRNSGMMEAYFLSIVQLSFPQNVWE